MAPARDDRVGMHEPEPVVRQDPERADAFAARAGGDRDLARRGARVALRVETVTHAHTSEAGLARRLVVATHGIPREVLRMPPCGSVHTIVAAHRGRAERGTKVVVHAKHRAGVVRRIRGRR